MKFRFDAFRALDDRKRSADFHEGHSKILTDLGITNLTSNYPTWMDDPNVIVIIASTEEEGVVGGIRVHEYDGIIDLPIITAIEEQDAFIKPFLLQKQKTTGVVESCGLWNSKKVYGRGISPLLARASVSLTSAFKSKCLVCFSAPYTLRMIKSLGFNEISGVGDNGSLPYPTEKFISTALVIDDIYDITTATPENHERIVSLMNQPVQNHLELSQGKEILIEYNLLGSVS